MDRSKKPVALSADSATRPVAVSEESRAVERAGGDGQPEKTPLAADLERLPEEVLGKLREFLVVVEKFTEEADERDHDAFRGAYALAKVLGPVAGYSKSETARKCNSSPATFTRWLYGDKAKPHPLMVGALFEGLGEIAAEAQEALAKKGADDEVWEPIALAAHGAEEASS